MTSGKFAPVYKVYAGHDLSVTPVRRQDYPSPGPNFATADEAIAAAERMARAWLSQIPERARTASDHRPLPP